MKKQLEAISQKSQAETIDLWPSIYAELKETKTVKTRSINYHLMRLAAVFSLFFVGALVVYAVSQIYVDTGLEGERAERLVTPINLSVTQGDVTIVVDWAYADLNRVTLAYRVLDAEGNTYIPEGGEHHFQYALWIADPTVELPSQNRLAAMNWLAFRGYGFTGEGYVTGLMSSGSFTAYRGDKEQEIINFNPSFDPSFIEIPEILKEEMRIDFSVLWEEDAQPIFISFNLDVSPLQFEVYGVAMESASIPSFISEFGISPTHTNLRVCLDVPEDYQRGRGQISESYWVANGLKIYFDDVDIALLYPEITGMYSYGGGMVEIDGNSLSMYCTVLWLDTPIDTMPQTARIVFDEWLEDRSSDFDTMEEAETMAAVFQEHGYELSYWGEVDRDKYYEASWTSAFGWELLSPFEAQAEYEAILEDFIEIYPDTYRIEGPWEIEFQVSDPVN